MTESGSEGPGTRGIAPIVGLLLMIAVAIMLASAVAVFALDIGEEAGESGTFVSADFDADITTNATGGRTVNITHTGGESVPVRKLEIRVRAGNSSTATMGGFPLASSETPDVAGNSDLVDETAAPFKKRGVLDEFNPHPSNTWMAGQVAKFELNTGNPIYDTIETVTVTLIDAEENRVIDEFQLTIEDTN